jgi:NAD(P)H dehydrogenase (quinone)
LAKNRLDARHNAIWTKWLRYLAKRRERRQTALCHAKGKVQMIVVTGASGYIGSRAIHRLIGLGLPATAMGRDGARLRKVIPDGVPIAIADYDDPESLDRAFAKAAKLLFIASDGFADDMLRQHAKVIAAANRSPIEHVVFTSIVDVEEGSPFYFAPVYRDAEQRLKAARFECSVVRCGLYSDFILQHWLRETLISLPLADARIAPISRDDVAAALVQAVLDANDATRNLTGARSYSMAEIASAASRALGRPYAYQSCASEDYFNRLRGTVDDPWPTAFSSLCASICEGRFAATSESFAKMLSRPPEDFESFLKRS